MRQPQLFMHPQCHCQNGANQIIVRKKWLTIKPWGEFRGRWKTLMLVCYRFGYRQHVIDSLHSKCDIRCDAHHFRIANGVCLEYTSRSSCMTVFSSCFEPHSEVAVTIKLFRLLKLMLVCTYQSLGLMFAQRKSLRRQKLSIVSMSPSKMASTPSSNI